MGIAFETFVWLWALCVDLGRTCKVSGEFLAIFSTVVINFTVCSMIFLFYFSQCSKIVGYGGIRCDMVDMAGYGRICWDMLGYARICWDMLGYAGICWDMLGYGRIWWDMVGYGGMCWDVVGYEQGGAARGEKALHMLCKGFFVVPHGFYIVLESFLN